MLRVMVPCRGLLTEAAIWRAPAVSSAMIKGGGDGMFSVVSGGMTTGGLEIVGVELTMAFVAIKRRSIASI
jgi:hypothetical protein